MPKRRKDKEPVPVMPQQYTWRTEIKFTSFEGANAYKELKLELAPNETSPRKIKRRKDCFDVRVGTPVTKKD